VIKADLYPGIIDHMRKEAVHSNPMYTYKNRGAANPDDKGFGNTAQEYTAYQY
jgi:amidase/formamidase